MQNQRVVCFLIVGGVRKRDTAGQPDFAENTMVFAKADFTEIMVVMD
jgi:hypothetical protein